MEKKEVGFIYEFLAFKIYQNSDGYLRIDDGKMKHIIGVMFHIPSAHHRKIICELIHMNILSYVNLGRNGRYYVLTDKGERKARKLVVSN